MTTPHIAGLTFKLYITDGKLQVRGYMTTKLDICEAMAIQNYPLIASTDSCCYVFKQTSCSA